MELQGEAVDVDGKCSLHRRVVELLRDQSAHLRSNGIAEPRSKAAGDDEKAAAAAAKGSGQSADRREGLAGGDLKRQRSDHAVVSCA